MRVLSKILECDLGLSLSYHQVDDDQALENNGPCRVAQPVGKGSKDLCHASLAGVCGYQNVLDILGFWGGKLHPESVGRDRQVTLWCNTDSGRMGGA